MNKTLMRRLRVPAMLLGAALALGGVSNAAAQTAAGASTTSIRGTGLSMVRAGGSTTVTAPRGRAGQTSSRIPRTTLSQNWPERANDPGFETGSPNAALSPISLADPSLASPRTDQYAALFPQLVNDPGFDDFGSNGDPWWTEYSAGGFPLITSTHPASNYYSGDMCGYPNCTDVMQSSFTVPDNVSSATFIVLIDVVCPTLGTACTKNNNGLTFALSSGSGSSYELGSVWDQQSRQSNTYNAYTLGSAFGQATSSINPDNGYTGYQFFGPGSLANWLHAQAGQNVTLSISSATVSGNQSEWFVDSLALDVTAPPNPPTDVVVTSPGAGEVAVTWAPPSDAARNDVGGYFVTLYGASRNVVQATSTTADTTHFTFSSLPNGTPYYMTVEAENTNGSSSEAQGNSVTPFSGAASVVAQNAVSTTQYLLPNSDGSTWQRLDETNLSFEMTPSSNEKVILSANADLWTATAGVNQDVGICVESSPTATSTCTSSKVIAWKESGGGAGTFSPNAAFVQTVLSMVGGTTYRVDLVWKTNVSAIGDTIAAAAGGGPYSPTSLTARVVTGDQTAVSTQQYTLAGSDGTTWHDIDTSNLQTAVTPGSTGSFVISGNADMWTAAAGDNQDLAITVSPAASCGSSPSTLAAWKESGGFAGTFSPNAAFVQTVCTLQSGTTYTFHLAWKANHSTSDTIFIGAGGSPTFSPTRLLLFPLPANVSPTLWSTQVVTTQPTLPGNDGTTWDPLANMSTGPLSPNGSESVLLSVNADLWTETAGVNQDIGIFVSVDGAAPTLVGWKESGGFGGTFSPNAAFLQIVYTMASGHNYTFSLRWKANHPTSGTIVAGAGPVGPDYSPTRLSVIPA